MLIWVSHFGCQIFVLSLASWNADICGIDTKDQEWFCFNAQSLNQNGNRKNRTTMEGFWKATGKDREIKSRGSLVGMKKTLVYHRGRTPNGEGTKWVMHEYRTTQDEFDGTHPGQVGFCFSVCLIDVILTWKFFLIVQENFCFVYFAFYFCVNLRSFCLKNNWR